jgi:hypothetical protein
VFLGAIIVVLDEFGFSFLKPVSINWDPKGRRPIFRRVTKDRRALSTIAALTFLTLVTKIGIFWKGLFIHLNIWPPAIIHNQKMASPTIHFESKV